MRILFVILALSAILSPALPAVPALVSYQGLLADDAGNPITVSANVNFTFWDSMTGGKQIGTFTDTDTVTPDSKGLFNTFIGDDPNGLVPDSIFSSDNVWLNVRVNGINLIPRTRIVSAPYAFRSQSADSAVLASTAAYAVTAGSAVSAAGGSIVTYQPWFTWWWWSLPWRLGAPYQRTLTITPGAYVDCRGYLYDALLQDVQNLIADAQQRTLTQQALSLGHQLDGINLQNYSSLNLSPAIAALIESCEYLDASTVAVKYTLVSNKTNTDTDPRNGPVAPSLFPWNPGLCYALPAPSDSSSAVNLDDYILQHAIKEWQDAGGTNLQTIRAAMIYFYPARCGRY